MSGTDPKPDKHHTVTPMLVAPDAAAAIEFYRAAFEATDLREPFIDDTGRVGHAELLVGDSPIWIVDAHPEYGLVAPAPGLGSSIRMILYVEDADIWVKRAVALGAESVFAVGQQPYGEKSGLFRDPFGYEWSIRTRTHPAE